jgi:phosphatidylserine decarboxylase
MRLPFISPYAGWDLILAAVACGGLGIGLWWVHPALSLPPLFLLLLVIYFFRDPPRKIPVQPDVLVSPADGRVADIEEIDEPDFLRARALRIGIFLSPLNVHVNRAPCDAEVVYIDRRAGAHLPAYNPQAPARNVQVRIGLRETRPGGAPLMVAQVVGRVARRIVCGVKERTRLARGERFGMIRFGSRTELIVPAAAGFAPAVKVGDRVRGGVTVMGTFSRPPSAAADARET